MLLKIFMKNTVEVKHKKDEWKIYHFKFQIFKKEYFSQHTEILIIFQLDKLIMKLYIQQILNNITYMLNIYFLMKKGLN